MDTESRLKIPVFLHVLFWGLAVLIVVDLAWSVWRHPESGFRWVFLWVWVPFAFWYFVFGYVVWQKAPPANVKEAYPTLWELYAAAAVGFGGFAVAAWVVHGKGGDVLLALPFLVIGTAMAAQAVTEQRRRRRN